MYMYIACLCTCTLHVTHNNCMYMYYITHGIYIYTYTVFPGSDILATNYFNPQKGKAAYQEGLQNRGGAYFYKIHNINIIILVVIEIIIYFSK